VVVAARMPVAVGHTPAPAPVAAAVRMPVAEVGHTLAPAAVVVAARMPVAAEGHTLAPAPVSLWVHSFQEITLQMPSGIRNLCRISRLR